MPLGLGRLSAWRFGECNRPAVILSHGWGGRGAQFSAFVPALRERGIPGDRVRSRRPRVLRGRAVVAHRVRPRAGRRRFRARRARNPASPAWWGIPSAPRRSRRSCGGRARGASAACSCRRLARGRFRVVHEEARPGRGLPRGVQTPVERRYGVSWDELELPRSVGSIDAPALVIHDQDDAEVRIGAGLCGGPGLARRAVPAHAGPGPQRDPARRGRGARRHRLPQRRR